MSTTKDTPESPVREDRPAQHGAKPQEYYDRIKQKFAEERDLRLGYRPEGTRQYTSDLTGSLAKYEVDPYADEGAVALQTQATVEVAREVAAKNWAFSSLRLRRVKQTKRVMGG